MFRIGIIGCGKIAQVRHLPEYRENPEAEIYGLYDLNGARAAELAAEYGARAYPSVEAMLADPMIDAVSVCTVNDSHARIAIAALRAGKNVLCEKPMATTLEECEEMTRAAAECGRLLFIDQNQRLAEAHRMAHTLIEAGEIGRALTFATAFRHGGPETWSVDPGKSTWFFDRRRAAMGALADLGVHKIDLIQYLTGQTIVEVTARLCTLEKTFSDGSPITVDDNALCIFRMSGGAMGTMTASWTNHGPEDNSTVINGTQGVLRVFTDPGQPLTLIRKSGETVTYDVSPIQTNRSQTKSGAIDLFIECLKNPAVQGISAASVLPAMRAVFAAMESSETGRSVAVNGQGFKT